MAVYFFSRLSISMENDYLKKMEYLYNILVSEKPILYRRDYYKVINVEIRQVASKQFLTGLMVKYQAQKAERTLSDTNKIEDITLKNPILAQVRFIYDANESLFIYEEDRQHIPKETILDRFYSILKENAGPNLLPAVITPITEEYETFIDRLKKVKEIKRIRINLHPSNPNNRDLWKGVDEKLRSENLTHYTETQINKIPGQSINVDKETESKIMMGEDGYGSATATGIDANGEKIQLSTKSTELQAKADIESEGSIEEQIAELQKKTNEIKTK